MNNLVEHKTRRAAQCREKDVGNNIEKEEEYGGQIVSTSSKLSGTKHESRSSRCEL